MRQFFVFALVAVCLAGWLSVASAAAADPAAEGKGKGMFKAVVHVNFTDSERQKHGLKNIANMLKEVKTGDIEVVCHGGGIGLLVKDKSPDASEVERLMTEGVRFVACENTLKDKSIPKDSLISGVTTVPSGAVEVVRKQQDGYGYFRP